MPSPWLDSSWGDHGKMLAVLAEQREGRRRVMKSHVAADALPIDSKARYLFVGRNGKDLGISFHNYLKNFSAQTMAEINRIHAGWSKSSKPLVIPASMRSFSISGSITIGYGCCDLFDIMKSGGALRS